ncbi:helix-turn-helix domain-containing protein [Pedobacter heparinus]|uniref:helix-turn-helix domain-containing protein n=1 Tax=Pedobacter heparinus TaxID=984 RepID=UPI00292D7AAD|nr:helix-turn-helix domain-containing protein [Pedobacter heparinus]
MSIILFARFGQIIIYLLITNNELTYFPFIQKIYTPFYYAAPACFYLYITGFIKNRSDIGKFGWLHFAPAVLSIIHVLPWHFSSSVNWNEVADQIKGNRQLFITEQTGLFPAYFQYAFRPLLIISYLTATWIVALRSGIIQQRNWNNISNIWVFFCLIAGAVFQMLSILPLVFGGLQLAAAFYPWYIFLNSLTLLTAISFVLHQPKLLYGYLLVAVNWRTTSLETDLTETTTPATLSKKAILLPEQLSVYANAMKMLMETEKPFLIPDFQMIHLAQKLNIPVHHCSFVINNVIGKNFRDWINAYRIEDFMQQHTLKGNKMTIEAIAYESGFKSLATFYSAFKKETGLIPKAYFSDLKRQQISS